MTERSVTLTIPGPPVPYTRMTQGTVRTYDEMVELPYVNRETGAVSLPPAGAVNDTGGQ